MLKVYFIFTVFNLCPACWTKLQRAAADGPAGPHVGPELQVKDPLNQQI